jgi:hypothetical protein
MINSAIVLVTSGALAMAAAIGMLGWSGVRAARRGEVERRRQVVLDAYAEREVAREQQRKAARFTRKSSRHGTVLQLPSL